MLWSAHYPGIQNLIFHSCWSQRVWEIHNRLLCMAIVMCLVARNYSLHRTTQNNESEIGRFRCVMSFCNTS